LLTILAVLLGHAVVLIKDLSRGYRKVDLRSMMMRPYPRILVVQIFLLVGGLALMHSQVTALLAFVAMKIGIDLYMQRKIGQMFDRRAP